MKRNAGDKRAAGTSRKAEGSALRDLRTRLAEALAQVAATSDVLRLISSSPADLQTVFEEVLEKAVRVCGADLGLLFRYEADAYRLAASHGARREFVEFFGRGPIVPSPDTGLGRIVMTRRAVQIADVTAEDLYRRGDPLRRATADLEGIRTWLGVPMVKSGVLLGAIVVYRRQVRPFADRQVGALLTFADQAVIAIENVRLFNELQARNRDLTDALAQQTATSEVLSVISSSPTDVRPVFDVIGRSAARLCDGYFSVVFVSDGDRLHVGATHNLPRGWLEHATEAFPAPLAGDTQVARAVRERQIVHVLDMQDDPQVSAGSRRRARISGYRTWIAVPMLGSGGSVGAVAVSRQERRAFSDGEIALLETFADQAVIAIENVRLFKELQARTRDLTRSVEQLTALGDVSRKLSSTLDLDAVLATVVTRASQLSTADGCSVFEYDAATEAFHLRATHNVADDVIAVARRTPLRKGEGAQGRMAITRRPVQVADISDEDAYRGPLRDILLRTGTRAVLAIPMLREDELIGGLTVSKRTPGEFSPEVIELLATFATQSALAIQNARLFRELADKSHELEAASRHKSEFLANMSHELRTPLNAIIGFSEVLTERMFGELNDKQDEYLKDIYASGQHLLSLINDILDLSKIEAGRMDLELSDFDLAQAIGNAVTLVRERAGRRGITLRQAVDHGVGRIRGDQRKIKQVLLNLLSNALKFTPEGGRVDVQATTVDGMAWISVTDTGVGIAPEDQDAIFEEFRQVGPADRKIEGTGLGLALSRKFIELHGGTIAVESEVGRGATFTFKLPLRQGREAIREP